MLGKAGYIVDYKSDDGGEQKNRTFAKLFS